MVDKKYRKMNLTNDRKNTNKRTYMTHSFIDGQIYFILSMNFLDRCCKITLSRWKWNRSWYLLL